MLKKDDIKTLAERAGMNTEQVTKLIELHSSEKEEAIDFTAVPVLKYTEEQLTTAKANAGSEGKTQAFVESAEQVVKAMKRYGGLDFEGKVKTTADGKVDFTETAKMMLDPFKEKVIKDAKLPVEEKINEANQRIEALQKAVQDKEAAYTNLTNELTNFKNETIIRDTLSQKVIVAVPKGFTQRDIISKYRTESGVEPVFEDGNVFAKKGDKLVMDDLVNKVAYADAFVEWQKTSGFELAGNGGAGSGAGEGNYTGGAKHKTKAEAWKYIETNKIDPESAEAQAILKDAAEAEKSTK